jgi:hypothetical protein
LFYKLKIVKSKKHSVLLLAEEFSLILPMFGITAIAFTMVNYYKAAFTEPGFLPRGTPHETDFLEKSHSIVTDLDGQYYPEPKSVCLHINKCDYQQTFCVILYHYWSKLVSGQIDVFQ